MRHDEPRGSVERVFTNGHGDLVAVIRWRTGTGPTTWIGGGLRDGQSVRIRNGEVVGV